MLPRPADMTLTSGNQQRTHDRGQGQHDRKVAYDPIRAVGSRSHGPGIPGTIHMLGIFDPIILSIAISVSIRGNGRGCEDVRSITVAGRRSHGAGTALTQPGSLVDEAGI